MIIVMAFAVGIIAGAFGGILLKMGASNIGQVDIHTLNQLSAFLFKLFTNIQVLIGIFLYFFSAVVWSYLLTKLDLSLVQPILALTYVLTPILAIFILGEHVSALRWLGIFIIIIGVFVVARSAA